MNAEAAYSAGLSAYKNGRFKEAVPHFEAAVAQTAQAPETTSEPELAGVQFLLGQCLCAIGSESLVVPHFESSIGIYRKLDGQQQLADCAYRLAAVYANLQRPIEALAVAEEAATVYSAGGDENGELLALAIVADMLRRMGQHSTALTRWQLIESRVEGLENRSTSLFWQATKCITHLLLDLHRPEEALNKSLRACRLFEAEYGQFHVKTAEALQLVAFAYGGLNDSKHAEATSCRALAILEHLGLDRTVDFAMALFSHAALLDARRSEESLRSLQRALSLARSLLPADHPCIGGMLTLIAQSYRRLGMTELAAEAESQAATLFRRSQTRCAGPGCPRKSREDGVPLNVCVKCRATFYCGKACQTADWMREGGHKAECKALIAAAKVAAQAAAGK